MKRKNFYLTVIVTCLVFLALSIAPVWAQKMKIGYINSQKILATYKEAQDAQKKLDEINSQWQEEARGMQKELQELQDQLEAQSLLLSEEKKAEKTQQLQEKYIKFQQFTQQKWDPQQGEILKKQDELMGPIIEKINKAIKKVGQEEEFDYIFDVIAANIVYASESQPDLTDKVLAELEKTAGAATTKKESGK
ncbi:MAG: OmpH family outer membrane protein [candidate division KSB1 bacterium]|nr:OmpH family outer membrane protein [candidate division KSB1 bacterium]